MAPSGVVETAGRCLAPDLERAPADHGATSLAVDGTDHAATILGFDTIVDWVVEWLEGLGWVRP